MSNWSYDFQWRETMTDIIDLLDAENPGEEEETADSVSDRFQHYACLYIRYCGIYKRIYQCHDLHVHPQKRRDIKSAMQAVLGRLLEVKEVLKMIRSFDDDGRFLGAPDYVAYDLRPRPSEYVCLDDILVDLKLLPDVLELPIPRYFTGFESVEQLRADVNEDKKAGAAPDSGVDDPQEGVDEKRMRVLKTQTALLDAVIEQHFPDGIPVEKEVEVVERELPPAMSVEDALKLLQTAERGRQGRQRAQLMQEIASQEERDRAAAEEGGVETDSTSAAISCQRLIRGFIARRRAAKERDEELIFLGMAPAPYDREQDPQLQDGKYSSYRRQKQAEYEKLFVKAHGDEDEKLLEEQRLPLFNEMTDQFHTMHEEYQSYTKGFMKASDYPAEDAGGLRAVGKLVLDAKDKSELAEGAEAAPEPDAEEEEAVEELIPDFPWQERLEKSKETFLSTWDVKDESENQDQKHDVDMLRNQLKPAFHEKVRGEVDAMLKDMLTNMEKEMTIAQGKKYKAPKKAKPQKKAASKYLGPETLMGKSPNPIACGSKFVDGQWVGGVPGGSKKGNKNPWAKQSPEALFSELVVQGIIKKLPNVQLTDRGDDTEYFRGDFNYLGTTMNKVEPGDPTVPSLAQVRQAVVETCVLPFGDKWVHDQVPRPRKIMLYGPSGVGKTMLAHGVANELGAVFFDLSPANLDGKDFTKSKKQIGKVMANVMKLAIKMQPAVIYINDIDKVFCKKGKPAKGVVTAMGWTTGYTPDRIAIPMMGKVKMDKASKEIKLDKGAVKACEKAMAKAEAEGKPPQDPFFLRMEEDNSSDIRLTENKGPSYADPVKDVRWGHPIFRMPDKTTWSLSMADKRVCKPDTPGDPRAKGAGCPGGWMPKFQSLDQACTEHTGMMPGGFPAGGKLGSFEPSRKTLLMTSKGVQVHERRNGVGPKAKAKDGFAMFPKEKKASKKKAGEMTVGVGPGGKKVKGSMWDPFDAVKGKVAPFVGADQEAPRVLFITECRTPYMLPGGKTKKGKFTPEELGPKEQMKLMNWHDRCLFVPPPTIPVNFSSLKLIVEHGLHKAGVAPQYIKDDLIETLAHMCDSRPPAQIFKIINNTLSERRIERLNKKPLQVDEFVAELALQKPVSTEEKILLKLWTKAMLRVKYPRKLDVEEPTDGPDKSADWQTCGPFLI